MSGIQIAGNYAVLLSSDQPIVAQLSDWDLTTGGQTQSQQNQGQQPHAQYLQWPQRFLILAMPIGIAHPEQGPGNGAHGAPQRCAGARRRTISCFRHDAPAPGVCTAPAVDCGADGILPPTSKKV